MCGIFGISYGPDGPLNEDWTPSEFMQIMFPAIVHRGPHAYGWMYYDGESIRYSKFEGKADTKKALATMHIPDTGIQWLVCHVRYFTHGSPSNPLNNHPIPHGDFIGVHNGVLRNHEAILKQTGREDPKTQVDSEAIFAAVNKWGHRKGLNKIRGDMVTVYANAQKPTTLHVARTEGRPLVLCQSAGGARIFASEEKVIDACQIEHTDYSNLSRYRLIRIRTGKVIERINLDHPYQGDNGGYHGSMSTSGSNPGPLLQARATKRGHMLFPKDVPPPSAKTRAQRSTEWKSRLPKSTLRPAVVPAEADGPLALYIARLQDERDPSIRNLQDHDQFGAFYYFEGVMLEPAEYCKKVQAQMDADLESGDPTVVEYLEAITNPEGDK